MGCASRPPRRIAARAAAAVNPQVRDVESRRLHSRGAARTQSVHVRWMMSACGSQGVAVQDYRQIGSGVTIGVASSAAPMTAARCAFRRIVPRCRRRNYASIAARSNITGTANAALDRAATIVKRACAKPLDIAIGRSTSTGTRARHRARDASPADQPHNCHGKFPAETKQRANIARALSTGQKRASSAAVGKRASTCRSKPTCSTLFADAARSISPYVFIQSRSASGRPAPASRGVLF